MAQQVFHYNPKLTASTVERLETTVSRSSGSLVPVFLHVKSSADLHRLSTDYGVKFNVACAGMYTALVPTGRLRELASDESVLSIDAGRELHEMTDSARMMVHVDELFDGEGLSTGYDGRGIILGIVDSGFDFTHPNFRDSDGNCRVQCVWDQNANGGAVSSYGYGSVFDGPEQVLAVGRDQSTDTHGTHVLGIAAGSIMPYRGMAPEAGIAVVSTNRSEQGIVDGVDFLLKYAEKVGKPISINVSYGEGLGYKDGSGNLSVMLDNLLKDRKGQLLSIAVGNEGNRRSSLYGSRRQATYLQVPSYGRENLFMQGQSGHDYSLKIKLVNVAEDKTLFEQAFDLNKVETTKFTGFGTEDKDNSSLVVSVERNAVSGVPALSANLLYTKTADEEWMVEISTDGGEYLLECGYGSFSSLGRNGYADGTTSYTVASTATGHEPIAVGAYVSRRQHADLTGAKHDSGYPRGAAYPLSGQGSTFDGRVKPEVSAPGAAVVSSFNSFAAPYAIMASDKVWQLDYQGKKYTWGVAGGTSMATPVVSGILALWLQAFPQLTAADAKEAIQATAIHDEVTGDVPNTVYGYGKIDALAGLKYLVDWSAGMDDVQAEAGLAYDYATCTLSAVGGTGISVYALDGRLVVSTDADDLDMQSLPSGIYVAKSGCRVLKFRR